MEPSCSPGAGMKVAVLGCGAMGSVYACLLAAEGHDVYAVDVWKEHVDAINEHGLRVEGPIGDRVQRVTAVSDAAGVGGACDLVVLATKTVDVPEAARAAAKLLKEDGVALAIQNGLPAVDAISDHIDKQRLMLGVASNFGACVKAPGHAEFKSMGRMLMGELSGGHSERLQRIVDAWAAAGFNAVATDDVHKVIWEKLIINCANSATCTLCRFTVGQMMASDEAWEVALSCAREVEAVARAKGISLDFDSVEQHVRKFNASVGGARPSMLQDHLAGRRSEVATINGAIHAEAVKVGLDAPVNRTVAALVAAIESNF